MSCARSCLHSDRLVDRGRLLLLLLLPHQDETAIPAARGSLRRLLSPFLLRILCFNPGVPRARKARIRHVHWMANEHGKAEQRNPNGSSPSWGHDEVEIQDHLNLDWMLQKFELYVGESTLVKALEGSLPSVLRASFLFSLRFFLSFDSIIKHGASIALVPCILPVHQYTKSLQDRKSVV